VIHNNKMGSLKRGESQKFKFEDILCMVGENDRWQIIVFLFTWIEGCLIGFHHLSSSFLAASMPHWCNLDHVSAFDDSRLDSWTLEQKKQYALPYNDLTKSLHSCMVFDLSKEKNIDSNFTRALQNRPSTLAHLSCESLAPEGSRFSYDMSDEMDTIVNQWNLVCERLPLLSTIQGSYMGGVFVGCIFFGWASDRFGRRTTMLVAAVIQTVSSIAAAFATNYIIFIFLRFCIAFSVSGVFECGFVLVTEICGPKFRTYFGILTQFPFGIGAAMLPLIAYFVRDWQHLQLTISIPCICLCLYYWFVPESPRWLMAEGRYEEALKILKDGAKTNKRTLPPDAEMLEMLKSLHDEDEEEKTTEVTDKTTKEKVIDVFRELIILVETPEMRKRTLNIFYSWLVVAMVYYGLSFNTKNLGGNRYVSSFVSGFVEVKYMIPDLSRHVHYFITFSDTSRYNDHSIAKYNWKG
jgi:MFS family permease